MNTKTARTIIIVAAIFGFSVATGLAVHHNDKVSSDHAMMMSQTKQAAAVKKTASDAAMKQAESDKMAAHDTMMHDDTPAATDAMKQ